jgi:hypothetical protein
MNKHLIWIDDDDFSGWCCSRCTWGMTAPRLESTVAALAFNRLHKETSRSTLASTTLKETRDTPKRKADSLKCAVRSAFVGPHHFKSGDHIPVAALGIVSNSWTAYPDDKRSIRLGLGAMHFLRVTTNGFEGAAISQEIVRL